MAQPKAFAPVKTVCGVIYKEEALYERSGRRWKPMGRGRPRERGLPLRSDRLLRGRDGPGLRRRFMSFRRLGTPESLPSLKLRAIALEEALRRESEAAGRPVNIDPGLSSRRPPLSWRQPKTSPTASRSVAGSTPTSSSCSRSPVIRTLDWTYPDMRREVFGEFFREVRRAYLNAVRGGD